jgi:hypothetical protein
LAPSGELKPFPRKDKRKDHFLKVHKNTQIDLQAFDTFVASFAAEPLPENVSVTPTGFLDVCVNA